jgi:type IV pilus assembly protein PilX
MNRATLQPIASRRSMRGAALPIGLILLLILTLLGITAMTTGTTELLMAGNEQFRQNAFQAAESGLEQGLADLGTINTDGVVVTVPDVGVPGSATDQYSLESQYMGEDLNIPGYSAGKFGGLHFRVQSVGESARNATSTHEQGAYLIASSQSGASEGQFVGLPPVE